MPLPSAAAQRSHICIAFGEQVPNQNCRLPCSRDSGNLLAAPFLVTVEERS
jgi:hypothetical protein